MFLEVEHLSTSSLLFKFLTNVLMFHLNFDMRSLFFNNLRGLMPNQVVEITNHIFLFPHAIANLFVFTNEFRDWEWMGEFDKIH